MGAAQEFCVSENGELKDYSRQCPENRVLRTQDMEKLTEEMAKPYHEGRRQFLGKLPPVGRYALWLVV